MNRHAIFALLAACLLAACADEQSSLKAQIDVAPAEPLPGHGFTVEALMQVSSDGGTSLLTGAEVSVEAQMGDVLVDAMALEEKGDGAYAISDFIIPTEGEWTLVVSAAGSGTADTFEQTVNVTCGEARALDAGCCESVNCADGLWCEANMCSDAPRPVGETCEGSADCAGLLWCESSLCSDAPRPLDEACDAEAVCMEGLWCDTGVCSDGPRPNGLACFEAAECMSGWCEGGLCAEPPWAIIGKGDGSPSSVDWTMILQVGMSGAADLAFNPLYDNALWVVNRDTDSLTVIHDPGEATQHQNHYYDSSRHFLERVVALSFGDEGTFATCGDSRNTYDDLYFEQMDFMGPTLWPSNEEDFVTYGPDAAKVHLDMLHSSPECMGIAAAGANTFYTFSGYDGYLGWYDFKEPHADVSHGHGGEDHSDGRKWVFPDVELTRVANVPGHMVYDMGTGRLYVADTGTGRVLSVNPAPASLASYEQSWWGDGSQEVMTGATVDVLVAADQGVLQPSGLALHDGVLYVGDHSTGWIHAFTLDGVKVNSLDTGFGTKALGGLTVGPHGQLYIADMLANRILRINVEESADDR